MSEPRWLTHELFVPHVGETFELGDRGPRLVLDDAREHDQPGGPGPDGRARRQFSLFFSGPAEPALDQGTYALRHDVLGELDLFLVPVGRRGDGIRYEAAFA